MVCRLEVSHLLDPLSPLNEKPLTPVVTPAWFLGLLIVIVKIPSCTSFNVAFQYHAEMATPGSSAGGTVLGSIVKHCTEPDAIVGVPP